jgi:ribosomal protein S12 methylthiotransferase
MVVRPSRLHSAGETPAPQIFDDRQPRNQRRVSAKTKQKAPARRTFCLISLGCPKNLIDSERMAGLLAAAGYRMSAKPDGAEVVVVNTCGFIAPARDESYEVIEELLRLKSRGRLRRVVVAGCLAERDRQALLERYPRIDLALGVFARDRLVESLEALDAADTRCVLRPAPKEPLTDLGRRRLTLPHLAYLRIAEGCNRRCSFCTIPSIRGPYASKPIERVVTEAEELAADGVKELILVAQDTSSYGLDLGRRPLLAELLRRLECVSGVEWIRLMYLYPLHVTDELIELLAGGGATSRKILPYLDIPLQHISDDILRRMRRPIDRRRTEELLDRLRGRIEGLALRTTLMVGFPGETERHFAELLDFVRDRRFERLGVFAYVNEPGTPAGELDGQVPEDVKLARRDALMQAQREVAFAWNAARVGEKQDVLIDGCIPGEKNAYLGRSSADAPEIDGAVYVTGEKLLPGQILSCEIVAAKGYDLIAVANQT